MDSSSSPVRVNEPGAVVSLNALEKSYGGFRAVDGLSFSVKPKEIFGFLGPNGAGKTTTLRMILDIIRPSHGDMAILGSDSAISVRNRIGYLPEERGLYRKMRAVDTITYFGRLRGMAARDAKRRAKDLLDEFGLGPFARSRNEALSKGMAQKVQLLATLVHDPELLILDEPFSGLDPINQHTLETLIRRLRDEGKTVIFSTHVMEHAERLCDRFLILAKGKKRFEGTLDEARDVFPPRLLVRTADDLSPLRHVPGVIKITALGQAQAGAGAPLEIDYEIELARGTDIQVILRAAFEAGMRLSRFDHASTSLHDIFVSLAGEEGETQQKAPSVEKGTAQ